MSDINRCFSLYIGPICRNTVLFNTIQIPTPTLWIGLQEDALVQWENHYKRKNEDTETVCVCMCGTCMCVYVYRNYLL